jgi:hypothetical protein
MAEQRWAFPGLHYFEDTAVDRALFFGREKEIKQLAERMIAEDLTVLFGKSGDGKTSLINAGLKWAFRELGYLPVRARIFNVSASQTPLAALYEIVAREAKAHGLTLPADWPRETLWESFCALRPTEENGLKPIVLVLDQFEELFTLMAGRQAEQEDFIAQLADLVRGRMPETVREKYRMQLAALAPGSDEARQLEQLLYGSASPTIRILLSLREDYLAFLNNLGRRIPKVFASRYRLTSLSIEQARDAIAMPPQQKEVLGRQAFRIEEDATEALLKFLTIHSSRSGVSEEVVGPPQLQVLCRQLEEQRRERGKDSISVDDLGGEEGMRQLLSRYYRSILEKFPAIRLGAGPRRLSGIWGLLRRLQPLHSPRFAVRRLCEERLITAAGNRNSRHEDEIIREIGVAPRDLKELVESRLLRREPRLQESFYELSHDSLVPSLQIAGGMRQTWVMGLKAAAIVAIIFIVTNWGWPYVQSLYEIRSLESEFEKVESGDLDADYFRTRIEQARDLIKDETKLTEIQRKFDNWRLNDLQSVFLQTPPGLPRADSVLRVLEYEYPLQKELIAALTDTLNKRRILLIERRYWSLVLPDSGAAVAPRDSLEFARTLLEFAYTAFKKDARIVELQQDLAKRRGDTETLRQLNREVIVTQEIARKELLGAIQIEEPRHSIVKGDSSGKASEFEISLRYNFILANATVLLNGKEMSREEISSNKENMLQYSMRQKVMPMRAGKFLSGIVAIPAGARQVPVKITARNSEGVEVSRDFVFTVDRALPSMKSWGIFYREDKKEAWKEMPKGEWRGNFWRIEVEANEPLQAASMKMLLRSSDSELSKIPPLELEIVPDALSKDSREATFFQQTSDKYKTAGEVECTLRLQDLAGWESTISLGKRKVVKAQAVQAQPESKSNIQLPIKLRNKPVENLTEDEVRSIIKKYDFYCSREVKWSNLEGKGITHDFIPQQNGQVIFDRATGLMWQQSGSGLMTFEQAQKYVEVLNSQKFAGFSDWRLPTLEEAMSLMEPKMNNRLYLDPVFDRKQAWIWTADKLSAGRAWRVGFYDGVCSRLGIDSGLYVRAVRS